MWQVVDSANFWGWQVLESEFFGGWKVLDFVISQGGQFKTKFFLNSGKLGDGKISGSPCMTLRTFCGVQLLTLSLEQFWHLAKFGKFLYSLKYCEKLT